MGNPNAYKNGIATQFKPGNKMGERKRGMKYKVKNEILNFIQDIPAGQKPWERMYQIANAQEDVSVDIAFRANKTLGDWGLQAEEDKAVSVSVDISTPDNIDELLFKRLGIAQDEQRESTGEANTNGETTESTST